MPPSAYGLDRTPRFLSTIGVAAEQQWGGKRKGAGRKAGLNVRVSLVIPRQVWTTIEAMAQDTGQLPEELVMQWLQEKLAPNPRSEH